MLYPVVLSGGSGTRLWPMSRSALPKQLLSLVTERTLLQETVLRVQGLDNIMPPVVVCADEHRFLVAEQLRQIGVEPGAILLEPCGRNTALAAACAASWLINTDPDAKMLVLPADHVVDDVVAWEKAVQQAMKAAAKNKLVTFGVLPSRPEAGYGYIKYQSGNDAESFFPVAEFVEKPDIATARQFLEHGKYVWNSGIFLFRAAVYLDELQHLRPEIADASHQAISNAHEDMTFSRLGEAAYNGCPSESIDYAVMEQTRNAAVVLVNMGWSDVGSWATLADVQQHDENGNVLRGDTYVDGVKNSLIYAENRLVAAIGLEDVVVVETKDAVLVATKTQIQHVKHIVNHLKSQGRNEHLHHARVYRPWGYYELIDRGERFQVKRISVNPGGKLSLQMHHHRAEHWVVVSGTARVTVGNKDLLLTENESVYIPIGKDHRLENPGKLPLHLIEVQSGAYLGEDDIVRFEDVYQRV